MEFGHPMNMPKSLVLYQQQAVGRIYGVPTETKFGKLPAQSVRVQVSIAQLTSTECGRSDEMVYMLLHLHLMV